MRQPGRLRRFLLFGLGGLLALAAAGLVAVQIYLSSGRATPQVAAGLSEALGAAVRVEDAAVGLAGSTTLRGLVIAEPGDPDRPLLEADTARADLSALGYAAGARMPRRLELTGARLRLRFAADGTLLTRLPTSGQSGAWPALVVHAGKLTIDQQGRAPFTVEGVEAELTSAGTLEGSFTDPRWGTWSLAGDLSQEPLRGTVRIHNPRAEVTPARLRSLPFVPPATWAQIEAEGTVPLTFTLTLNDKAPALGYRVEFAGARARLPQPDRPPLDVSGVSGVVEGTGAGLKIAGAIRDPYWGDWEVEVAYAGARRQVDVHLWCADAEVDQRKLEALPYVPGNVWEQVQAAGRTPVDVRVRLTNGKPDVHYRVTLAPSDTQVRVAAIDLEAYDASGRVVIEDGRVTLAGVKGGAAGGTVACDGDLDFTAPTSRLHFRLEVGGLALSRLPASWELPTQLEGRLNGNADLTVTVGEGKPFTRGGGQGVITQAKLLGFKTREDIRLALVTDGGRLRIRPHSPVLHSLLHVTAPTLTVAPDAPPARPATGPYDPGRLAGLAVRGLTRGVSLFASGVGKAVARLSTPDRKLGPKEEVTYLEANLGLEDVDLAELVKRLNVKLPIDLAGRLTFQVKLGIPVNGPRETKAYRLDGSASLSRLRVAGVDLAAVKAEVNYREGLLRLDKLSGQVPWPGKKKGTPGTFAGNGRVQVFPQGELAADLKVAGVPLEVLPGGLGKGGVSGDLKATAPLAKLGDPATWKGTGTVRADDAVVFGLPLTRASAGLTLRGGALRVADLKGNLAGGPLAGSGRLDLKGKLPYQANLSLGTVDLGRLDKVAPGFKLPFPVSGKATVGALLTGTAQPVTVDAALNLKAAQMRVRGINTQRLEGTVRWGEKGGRYSLKGEALGGRFTLEGQLPPLRKEEGGRMKDEKRQPEALIHPSSFTLHPSYEGRFRLERARLSRLWRDLRVEGPLAQLRGVVSADLDYDVGPDGTATGRGRLAVRDLRHGDTELSDSLTADLRLERGTVFLRDLGGAFAGGLLRGLIAYPLGPGARGFFTVTLSGAEASRVLVFAPGLAEAVRGPLDLSLRGSVDGEWRGGGTAVLTRGRVMGVEVSEWRLPLQFALAPARGSAELQVRESGGQVGGGRLRFRAEMSSAAGGWRVSGQLQLLDAQVRHLTNGDVTSYAQGRVSGRFDFGGGNVRSVNDLTGTVQATLNQTQAFQLPVLSQLAPYLVPGRSSSTFGSGELRGRLAGGVLRLERLTLRGPYLDLWASGSVTLVGRLDLDVVARTLPTGVNPVFLRVLARRIPPVGPVPLNLVLLATSQLADRVVRLRVTGTVRNPVVRAEPISILAGEAVRFFLNRSLAPTPGGTVPR